MIKGRVGNKKNVFAGRSYQLFILVSPFRTCVQIHSKNAYRDSHPGNCFPTILRVSAAYSDKSFIKQCATKKLVKTSLTKRSSQSLYIF